MLHYQEKEFKLTDYGSRLSIKKQVVREFLKENPGTGRGDAASRYKYCVETLKDGTKIILTRPTSQGYQKLRGFDFRIDVPGITFNKKGRARQTPSHDDILDDLKKKRREHPRLKNKLLEAIERVYDCEDVGKVFQDYRRLNFTTGFSVELLLKVINWMFIEQDMRDWNFSGRMMLMNGIEKALK